MNWLPYPADRFGMHTIHWDSAHLTLEFERTYDKSIAKGEGVHL